MLPSRKENNKQKKKKPNTNLKAHINKEANKHNNNKKQTKKKYKKNHPTINCGARTCDSGLYVVELDGLGLYVTLSLLIDKTLLGQAP